MCVRKEFEIKIDGIFHRIKSECKQNVRTGIRCGSRGEVEGEGNGKEKERLEKKKTPE